VSRLKSKVIVTAKDLLNGTPTKLLTDGFSEGRSDTVFWRNVVAATVLPALI